MRLFQNVFAFKKQLSPKEGKQKTNRAMTVTEHGSHVCIRNRGQNLLFPINSII